MGIGLENGEDSPVRETPYYFERNGLRIFGVLHHPETPENGCGVVFCHSLFEEKICAHRVFVNFARFLARSGYTVLRFDATGHGDSEGTDGDMCWDSLQSDLERAVSEMKRIDKVRRIGLLGLRVGALWAARFAVRTDVDFLVLWQPVTDMNTFFQECFVSNMATQMFFYGKPRVNRKEMVEILKRGGTVSVDGYLLGKDLYEQMLGMKLTEDECRKHPTLIVRIGDRSVQPSGTDWRGFVAEGHPLSAVRSLKEERFWKDGLRYVQRCDPLFQETLSWME